MAPAAQPNLYCEPNDVYDWLGIEGVQLRLDDMNLATGQTVLTTSTAAAGATSISITALQFPLIKGTSLVFTGGGTEEAVTAVLGATAAVGAVTLSVAALTDAIAAQAEARDSGVNTALAARLVKACNYGTSQVKLYCCGRYNDSDLATAWSANRWATTLASEWLCRRCLRSTPETITEDAKQVRKELREVQMSMLQVEGIGTRTAGWPFVDNLGHDIRYSTHKTRLEQSISDPTVTQFAPYIDWSDALGIGNWGW